MVCSSFEKIIFDLLVLGVFCVREKAFNLETSCHEKMLKFSTWGRYWCVFANYSNIFRMIAVVTSPSAMATLCNALFISNAMNVVKPNLIWCSVPLIPATAVSAPSPFCVTQHAANDVCFHYSPVVVTNRSPSTVQVQFHSSLI